MRKIAVPRREWSLGWTTREAFSEARRQARRSRTASVCVTAKTQIKLPMPIILPDRSTEFIGAANPGITGRVLARHDLGRCRGWCAGTG